MEYPKFPGTEVNRHSGNLKGLMGTCKHTQITKGFKPRPASPTGISKQINLVHMLRTLGKAYWPHCAYLELWLVFQLPYWPLR